MVTHNINSLSPSLPTRVTIYILPSSYPSIALKNLVFKYGTVPCVSKSRTHLHAIKGITATDLEQLNVKKGHAATILAGIQNLSEWPIGTGRHDIRDLAEVLYRYDNQMQNGGYNNLVALKTLTRIDLKDMKVKQGHIDLILDGLKEADGNVLMKELEALQPAKWKKALWGFLMILMWVILAPIAVALFIYYFVMFCIRCEDS